MSYRIKTLIVFDTNSLRDTKGSGDVVYNSFSFGSPYIKVEQFIKENKLGEDVALAVPEMVIAELKQQKQRSYQKDIQDLKKIVSRLKGLPHINAYELKIPDDNFNCAEFIENEAHRYITDNGINAA